MNFPENKRACHASQFLSPLVILVIFSVSFWFRFSQYYFLNRSLWFDEASYALEILRHSRLDSIVSIFFAHHSPIQIPLGFFILQKLAVCLLGPSELSLRLFPFIFGCCSIIFFFLLARKTLDQFSTMFVTAGIGFSWPMVYFSSECKFFSLDVLVVILILLFTVNLKEHWTSRSILFFGCMASIMIWLSHISIFVVVPIFAFFGFRFFAFRTRHLWLSFSFSIIIYLISFATFMYFIAAQLKNQHPLHRFWDTSFLSTIYFSDGVFYQLKFLLFDFYSNSLSFRAVTLSLIISFVGLVSILNKKDFLISLPVVILLVLAASWFKYYPLSQRSLLFLVPVVLLVMGRGMDKIRTAFGRGLTITLAFIILLPSLILTMRMIPLVYPDKELEKYSRYGRVEIRPLLNLLRSKKQDSDVILLFSIGQKPFEYYSKYHHNFSDLSKHSILVSTSNDMETQLFSLLRQNETTRLWYLMATHLKDRYWSLHEKTVNLLDRTGIPVEQYQTMGSALTLYEITSPNPPTDKTPFIDPTKTTILPKNRTLGFTAHMTRPAPTQ